MEKLFEHFKSDIQFTEYDKRVAFRRNAGYQDRFTMRKV